MLWRTVTQRGVLGGRVWGGGARKALLRRWHLSKTSLKSYVRESAMSISEKGGQSF